MKKSKKNIRLRKDRIKFIKKYAINNHCPFYDGIMELLNIYQNKSIIKGNISDKYSNTLFRIDEQFYEFEIVPEFTFKPFTEEKWRLVSQEQKTALMCLVLSFFTESFTENVKIGIKEKDARRLFIEFLNGYETYFQLQSRLNEDVAEAIFATCGSSNEKADFLRYFSTGVMTPNGIEFVPADVEILYKYLDFKNQNQDDLEILIKYFEKRLWRDDALRKIL